jgi:hypothetical protein
MLPWERSRANTILALADSYDALLTRSAQQLALCCCSARLAYSPGQATVKLLLYRCHHRLCPYCSRARTQHIARQIADQIRTWPSPRTVILTVRSNDDPLPQQLRFLRHSFSLLRRTAPWRAAVEGGIYTIEITVNQTTHRWHPHLHIVYAGKYLPQRTLQHHWHAITHGSKIVWIAAINSARSAAMELAAYIGKPPDSQTWSPQQYRAYARATKGTRMLQTFGALRWPPLNDTDPRPPIPPDEQAWSLSYLYTLTQAGSATAARILCLIALRWPYMAPYILHAMPQLEADDTPLTRKARILASLTRTAPPTSDEAPHQWDPAKLDEHLHLLAIKLLAEHEASRYATLPATDEELPPC